jgi:hypothetical protein
MPPVTPKVDLKLLTVEYRVDVVTSVELCKGKITKLSEGQWGRNVPVHFEGHSKQNPK